ncbi:hypothetical protein [Neptuniibacter sp. CAU 1671]|uniref:hypothetical protein n=1 Tax=Neptuniibacter sp. CAU 1671 TaxID=3032593 RepID=UPI0023DC14D8|nr:hypothetical protein [Neptuniibacter sp. CAU 1671]MDF2183111.1 hypothetical protein [Neptuniibacter sp. CAU 1671]
MMQKNTLSVAVMVLSTAVLTACQSETADNKTSAPEAAPLHQQLLAALQAEGGVKGDRIAGVSPVHTVFNPEAPIPPQCYTRTEGTYNPCYVCHQDAVKERENQMQDGEQQLAYNFSEVGVINHWQNLFEDRSAQVAAISDAEIKTWVNQDNYSALKGRLEAAEFKGWIPDLANLQRGAAAFDEFGFALDGSGWVAFNYKPFPSTFWPTNGSTDDVMIRLSEPYRTDAEGQPSLDVYRANLALVEANIKGLERISSLPIDEQKLGADLNGDNQLSVVTEVLASIGYQGAAKGYFKDTYLYPEGTEFLHTVRYLGMTDSGEITVSSRMKEVRYLKKWVGMRKETYAREYESEIYEKDLGHLPQYKSVGDHGLDNDFGWSVQGFIEDVNGDLRVSTYEENLFCMGCHASIGATIDKTFGFPRKVDGAAGWGYINLKGMPDAPNMGELKGEILTYLERVGGGGEFRSNPEMQARWFDASGTQVDQAKFARAKDVYDLIMPSIPRALELNKAYKVIVHEQDFMYGRDATVLPPNNVFDKIDMDTAPTLPEEKFYRWDIRLDWNATRQQQLVQGQ